MCRKLGGPFTGNGSILIHSKVWQYPILENVSVEKLIKGSLKNNMGWNHVICVLYQILSRARGSVVVMALCYWLDGPGIDSRWCHWGFFPWFFPTKPCALRLTQPLKMSTRDFSWGKGSQCVWLTTYHPSSAEHRDNLGP